MMEGEKISFGEAMQRAAALPQGAPLILGNMIANGEIEFGDQGHAPTDGPDPEVCAVIDIDEFEEDLRDPLWREFLREAAASYKQLVEEGRAAD